MSDAIYQDRCAFVGTPAWHGQGIVLDPQWCEGMTGEQMRTAFQAHAKMDYDVEKVGCQTIDGTTLPGVYAVIRTDDGSIVSGRKTVGEDFEIVQNSQAFKFFDPFLDSGRCKLEAAGVLADGAKVWVLVRIDGAVGEVLPGDPVESFFLLAHAHDGTLACNVGFTNTRVVCQNTLSAALGSSRLLKVKHTKNVRSALEMVQEITDMRLRQFQATIEQMQALTRAGCSDDTLKAYVRAVFTPAKVGQDDAAKTLIGKIQPLFESGRGTEIAGVKGTMWGAYNAVTEYLTHERGHASKNAEAKRLESLWFGQSAKLANMAFTTALEMAGNRPANNALALLG